MNGKKVITRNISEEIFNAWKTARRHGDGKEIEAALNISNPTAMKALKYGHVTKTYLADAITKFFIDRARKEADSAKELTELLTSKHQDV